MIATTFPNGLRPPQLAGALKIAQDRRMLLADQPGAGKTAQALVALEVASMLQTRRNILILAPQTACQLTWAGELERRVSALYDVEVCDLTAPHLNSRTGLPKKSLPSLAERDTDLQAAAGVAELTGEALIVLANFEQVRVGKQGPAMPAFFEVTWDAVIIDESHLVLPTSEDDDRSQTQVWRGLRRLRTSADVIRLAMSGTPDRGKLQNRYGTWKFLWPEQHQNYWGWARHNFVITMDQFTVQTRGGGEKLVNSPVFGKLRDEGAWSAFEQRHMLRRTKAEMLKGLPAKQWADDGGIDLPMTPLQSTEYHAYQDYLQTRVEELISGDEANKAAGLRLQFFLRSRQMATCTWDYVETEDEDGTIRTHGEPRLAGREGSSKLAWVLDWLEARGYTKANYDASLGKVVIVSYFTQVLRWMQQELEAEGIDSMLLTGDQNQTEKQRVEAAFQRGNARVMLLSGHLGVSINLDAADDMIFLDAVQDPDMLEQAEDRIHRASRNHQVTYWRLASIGTTDQAVLMDADGRYAATRARYDGDRGVQFARRMMRAGAAA